MLFRSIYPERDFYIPDREQILDMDDHGLFIFMQKYIVGGLTAGAVKE